ncbi:hypothetical protein KZC51_05980 [Microbacterium sp. SSW1-49]|uniref:Uncharacterized protein n=1 Tax=Microbacterium croceum TaxID=2851645 RepID=A0ABT0FC94_9MICO|nr:hypothetical protein [Microbacterium croceum]MCK2035680.1 hypothetical protein [Microbacterium croceum]
MTDKKDGGIRRGFIILWTLVGLLLLATATWLADGWSDSKFWSSVLVNLGTTIFLAGFLVWLERRLVATTRTVAKEAATEAASAAATVAAEEATKVLTARLDAIQDRFEEQLADQVAHEDSAVSALSGDISYGNVMNALMTARQLGVVDYELLVTAGEAIDAPVVSVGLKTYQQQDYLGGYDEPVIVGLKLSVDTQLLGTAYVVEANWDEADDPIEVFARLRSEMVRVGYGPEARGLNLDRMFRLFKLGLEEGMAGRRGDDGSWRSRGKLLDVISDDWVVSELGVEHREHGIVVDAPVLSARSSVQNPYVAPPVPEWAEGAAWKLAIGRGRERLEARSFF